MVTFLNAAANLLWTALFFLPVSLFCFWHVSRPWLYSFLAISLIPHIAPAPVRRWTQLSPDPAAYLRWGVPQIHRFVQDGKWIRRVARRRQPDNVLTLRREHISRLLRTTYMREQFHASGFLFFLLTAIYALLKHEFFWALAIVLANTGYNLYPLWLQQYLRLRLLRLSS